MFFGTSLTSSLVKSQLEGLSPMNEEPKEDVTLRMNLKKKQSG